MAEAITETPATPAAPEASTPAPTVDDLQRFLAEFDAVTNEPEKAAPAAAAKEPAVRATNAPTDNLSDFLDGYEATGGNTEKTQVPPAPTKPNSVLPPPAVLPPADAAHVYQLERQLGAFANFVQGMHAREVHKENLAEFENIVGRADAMLKDAEFPVGGDYAKRWLLAEAQMHPELADAFDKRNRSPQDYHRYQRIEKRAFEKMYKAAKAEPDQRATEDRRLIVAAMMGRGASATAPEEKPVKYGDLDDAQFTAEKKKLGL